MSLAKLEGEIYGGFETIMSQHWGFPLAWGGTHISSRMSPCSNMMSLAALGSRPPWLIFHLKFSRASVTASLETSMPRMCRFLYWSARREWSRRGIQPVPVQRSRIRTSRWSRRVSAFSMSVWARWVVYVSVSGLGGVSNVE